MTRDLAAEWRDLLASGRAAWRPGMRATWPSRVVPVQERAVVCGTGVCVWWSGGQVPPEAIPDFDDPATLGCLIGLVREAWGDPGASSVYQPAWDTEPARWCVAGLMHGGWRGEFADSEAAALLSALAAAPVRT